MGEPPTQDERDKEIEVLQATRFARDQRQDLNSLRKECMSKDVRAARHALLGYLYTLGNGLIILGHEDEELGPLVRLCDALTDLQFGAAPPELFAVDRRDSRPPKGIAFQETLGAACAAITVLVRDGEEKTNVDAAKTVAKKLKELGLPLPDVHRPTGKSDKPQEDWQRLLDFHYKILRGGKHPLACNQYEWMINSDYVWSALHIYRHLKAYVRSRT